MTETDDQTPIPNELTVKLENFSEGISIEKEISYEPGKTLVVDSVIPGIYSITIFALSNLQLINNLFIKIFK